MNQRRSERHDRDLQDHKNIKYSSLVIFKMAASMCWGDDKARGETHVVTEVERKSITNCLCSIKISHYNENHQHGDT
jgi:hypothetical protein